MSLLASRFVATGALADLTLHSTGKVREMYEVDGDLLMVASDRISAYDVIMPTLIPDKGRVLTQMSLFWFDSTADICPNHFVSEVVHHDENIDFDRAAEIIGDRPLMEELRRVSIELYSHAAAHAESRGIILADTKFEFGASPGAEVVLGDEVFTPDSSRFWPADEYEPGRPQRSFDKQYLRDWLDETGWDHSPPAPELPDEVVANTRAKYLEAHERITGRPPG